MVHICASQSAGAGQLNPIKAAPGESLPQGFSRSYAGFFIKDLKREIQVD
jgi:hypothetical protein